MAIEQFSNVTNAYPFKESVSVQFDFIVIIIKTCSGSTSVIVSILPTSFALQAAVSR